jgi:hypothetical protein
MKSKKVARIVHGRAHEKKTIFRPFLMNSPF